MKRILLILVAFVMGLAACSGDAEKGINKHKEKPVAAPSEKKPDQGEKK